MADDLTFSRRVPTGDSLPRDICGRCGFIHYVNPKIVVGSVVLHEVKFPLCRRVIAPFTNPEGENGNLFPRPPSAG